MNTTRRLLRLLFAALAAVLLLALPAGAEEAQDGAFVVAQDDYDAGSLATPRNLKAVQYGASGIRLSWTATSGATHYYIFRYNFNSEDWDYIGTAYKAAYYDGGLAAGITYYYSIQAVGGTEGNLRLSEFTDYVGATIVGAPAAPKNVQAAVYGAKGIRLTWTASPGATQYNIYRYNGAKKAYVYIGTAYKAAYYDGSRAVGTTYYYKIKAVRKADGSTYVSGFSAAANAKAVGAPVAPRNMKAAVYGAKGIRLTWTASPGATQYNVYRYNGAKKAYVYIGTAYKAAYYDGSRAVGTTYYYKVKAVCKANGSTYVSGFSAAANAKAAGTPVAPRNVKAEDYGTNGVRLAWTASPGATQYNVYRYNGTKKAYVYIGTAYKAAYYDGGRAPGVTYYYKVNAVCKAGGSTWVSAFSAAASAMAVGAPAVPKNVKAAAYGEYGVRLTWTASAGATHYNVYRYNGTEKAYLYIGTAYKAAYYDGGRAADVTYYYKVTAVYRGGGTAYESGKSAAASATAKGKNVFEMIPSEFSFYSGVGGWGTTINISGDGSFEGQFHDSDMGDRTSDYPNGTVYICDFYGKFTDVKRIDAYTYSMRLEYLVQKEPKGKIYYSDGFRYICSYPYGLENAGKIMLYLPGKPSASVPEPVYDWGAPARGLNRNRPLELYCIYNVNQEEPFFAR